MRQGLEAFIDWLEFTLFELNDLDYITYLLLGMTEGDFVQMPKGKQGYKKQLCAPGVTILSQGTPEMGTHIIITGRGCRYFEQADDLIDLIHRVKEYKHSFTRIDLALDDRSGRIIDLKKILSSVEKNHYSTRWKGYTKIDKFETKNNEQVGQTLYFGSRQSLLMMRVYKKGLEQESKTDKEWTRLELELKGERAQLLLDTIDIQNGIGLAISGILQNYIRFLLPSRIDKNKSRWKDAPWWAKIVKSAQKLKLTKKPEPKTVEEVKNWLEKQVATSLAIVCLNDMASYRNFLERLTVTGRVKMASKHWRMLQGVDRDKKFHF